MKIITIKQPWAWLIAAGIKPIENRTWPTKFRGRILIHSGQSHEPLNALNEAQREDLNSKLAGDRYPYPGIKNYSAIIGSVEIVDCVQNHSSKWAEPSFDLFVEGDKEPIKSVSVYNWVLDKPVLFDKPIENVKGRLSFWEYELPEEYLQEIERKLSHV